MKRALSTLALGAVLTLGLAFTAAALPADGSMAPDFTLKTLDGKTAMTLSDLRGKVVYIDFWASWCGPCRKAFPEVKALHQEFGEQGLEVLAVSLDRTVQPAQKFIKKQKPAFPSLHDAGGGVAKAYGVQSIPTAVIIGPDGKVAMSLIGFDPRRVPEIKKTIADLLGEATPAVKKGKSS